MRNIEQKNIFSKFSNLIGYADHNVGSGVLRGSSKKLQDLVDNHYVRLGHAAKLNGSTGAIYPEVNDRHIGQIKYLERLYGVRINIVTTRELMEGLRKENIFVVPYINTKETTKKYEELKIGVWGIPSELVERMKNKAKSTKDLDNGYVPGLCAPDNKISSINNLMKDGVTFVNEMEKRLEKAGMLNSYPLELIIKAAESDGGYGRVDIVRERDYKNGRIKLAVIPNGERNQKILVNNWEEALQISQILFKKSINPNIDNRVIIYRKIDLDKDGSPGMSVVIVDGHVFSLGFNAQVQERPTDPSGGTSVFNPHSKFLLSRLEELEEKVFNSFKFYLKNIANEEKVDFSKVTGVANIDLLIPGKRERQLLKALGKPQNTIYVTEFNPRWTNWSDALALVAWVEGLEHSVAGLKEARNRNVLTIDKLALPKGTNLERLRDQIFELDLKISRDGNRIVLRMPDNPAGFVFVGNIEYAKKVLQKLLRK